MNKEKNIGWSIINSVNPFPPTIQKSERLIRFLTLVFGTLSIYLVHREWNEITFLLSKNIAYWEYSIAMYFFPIVLLLLATLLFGLRSKVGWIMMCTYLTFSIIKAIGNLVIFGSYGAGEPHPMDSLFTEMTFLTRILTILFYIGWQMIMIKTDVMSKFDINRKVLIGTICISTIFTILFAIPY